MRHQMQSHPSPVNLRSCSTIPSDCDSRSKDSQSARLLIGKPMKISTKPPEKASRPTVKSPVKKAPNEKKIPVAKKKIVEKQPSDKMPQTRKVL